MQTAFQDFSNQSRRKRFIERLGDESRSDLLRYEEFTNIFNISFLQAENEVTNDMSSSSSSSSSSCNKKADINGSSEIKKELNLSMKLRKKSDCYRSRTAALSLGKRATRANMYRSTARGDISLIPELNNSHSSCLNTSKKKTLFSRIAKFPINCHNSEAYIPPLELKILKYESKLDALNICKTVRCGGGVLLESLPPIRPMSMRELSRKRVDNLKTQILSL
jgi:hypothetical protein